VLEDQIAERFKTIAAEVCAEHNVIIEALEVMPDPVHAVLNVDPQLGIHLIVKRIKGRSARLLREEFPSLKSRLPSLWTNSYFVSTTGGAPLDIIRQYVETQRGV
jgi:putative transposase